MSRDPSILRPKLGVSGCLLGEKLRFDGQHKRDTYLVEELGSHVDWVSFCPEVGIGLSVPRASIRLVSSKEGPKAMMGGEDLTGRLRDYAVAQLERVAKLGLSGFVLKKNSPSCGMERVRVYSPDGPPNGHAPGIFAELLQQRFPSLPIEEEGRLRDEALRETFIERIFAYSRLQEFFALEWKPKDLVAFHTKHKFQLLAHSPRLYRELGRLVASATEMDPDTVKQQYIQVFMDALKVLASKGRNTNTLEHMAGYFKKQLHADEKAELCRVIQDYRVGWVPLVVPITLIHHYVRKFQVRYLLAQSYLEPNPRELMLRNHV
ncbi:MAG: DUF523 and DUF1722 domain-containing protein [Bdellovibrionota bacterium]